MANVMERISNAEQLLPEICTLDCGTLNGYINSGIEIFRGKK